MNENNFIGVWKFYFHKENKRDSILDIREDGIAITDTGNAFEWRVINTNQIEIYKEGFVKYVGELLDDRIKGIAKSERTGETWEWYASQESGLSFNPSVLFDTMWVLHNDTPELEDDTIKFCDNGVLLSLKYGSGEWFLNNQNLRFVLADNFLTYISSNYNVGFEGAVNNQIGDTWRFILNPKSVNNSIIKEVSHIQSRQEVRIFYKDNADLFLKILEENGISELYHFTAKANIPSIKKLKGLYSWKYLQDNNIHIPDAGGNDQSRELDKKAGLEDYVRTSFCADHPMMHRKRDSNPVVLKISIKVVVFRETLFSDINAASPRHMHGSQLEDLKRVDFRAVKRGIIPNADPDFKKRQAEVMVKTCIPLQYILNINEF